jgi:hypothetical protein
MKYPVPFLILFVILLNSSFAQTGITKADYITYLKKVDEQAWSTYDQWQKADPGTRSPDPPEVYPDWDGRVDALLWQVVGDRKYAERALTIMRKNGGGDYTVRMIHQLHNSGLITPKDLRFFEEKLAEAADAAINYWSEWGAMNHSTNHVVNLLASVIDYLPDHPHVPRWKQKLAINLSSSWGLWSIEDSNNYLPIWFRPLMDYAELTGREKEFYALPTTRYYLDYFLQLLAPYGSVAEFGDGMIDLYSYYPACFEKGAAYYRDGRYKWAVHRMFQSTLIEGGFAKVWAAGCWADAYLWADDSVAEEVPKDGSRLVLEDYVGKKIVFRNGWDEKATHLFLNYLDDAPYGVDGKEQIINSINVETEKNHHGSADENAINLLMKNGSILLADAGYRETSSTGPDGDFRADTYHNKLIVRNGLADPNMRLLPFLLDGGRYRFVNTRLMSFRTFKNVDASRTRLVDANRVYQWDRVINYLKGPEWFVVIDIVKMLKSGPYTLANLFYSQDILDFDQKDRNWYDTRYSKVGQAHNDNPGTERLLIYFPEGTKFRRGAEQMRRQYQTEWGVNITKVDSFKAGDIVVFCTLLIPHSPDREAKDIVALIKDATVYQTDRGYGIKIPTTDGFIQLNAMLDLEAEYVKENQRPRYNWESGHTTYGGLETDARYCYLQKSKNELNYAFWSATKMIYENQTIFEAKGEMFNQDDGSFQKWGVPKWVAWEDRIKLK